MPERLNGSPGTDLLRVLRCALSAAPTWWTPPELSLVSAAISLPAGGADLVARLSVRTRAIVRRSELAADEALLGTIQAFGWLESVTPETAPAGVLASLSLADLGLNGPRSHVEISILGDPHAIAQLARHGPFLRLPKRARDLLNLAQLAAFGGFEDLSLLARIAVGQLQPHRGSPLARTLAGEKIPLDPLPWAHRVDAEATVAAHSARHAGPSSTAFTEALIAVRAAAGQPLHLAHQHLTPIHHWTILLWNCVQQIPLTPLQHQQARRALRQAPCAAGVAREVWEALHAAWHPRPAADRLAQRFASWAIWSEVDRAAWRARGNGTRIRRSLVWNQHTIEAWMEKGNSRVIAEGELVEDLALRRLAADGWHGIHAEGSFWLATAHLVLDVAEPHWCAPLQSTPIDWGRWGYGARRRSAIRARAAALVSNPEGLLAEALQRAASPLPGFLSAPSAESLSMVMRHLPARVLVSLLTKILEAPAEARGLPDLLVWKNGALAFWEVKSPGDQLSAAQRRWLTWLVSEGLSAGVLKITAKRPVQTTLFSPQPIAPVVSRPRLQRPRGQTTVAGTALIMNQKTWHPEPGSLVPGHPEVMVALRPWRDVRAELPFVEDRLISLAVTAVLVEVREGRKIRLRRWFTLPPGLVLVGAVRDEARPHGGVGPCVRLLTRSSGWLIPAELAASEPVVARPDELSNPTRDWVPHPDAEPPRPEAIAEAWGCGAHLRDQLLLMGNEPHALWIAGESVHLATAAHCPVLWTINHPRLVRDVLPD